MRAAVAERRLGFVVVCDVGVSNLEGVVAKATLLVAAHRARSGRRRRGVEEEVHAPVVVKVGDKDLLRVCELDARVVARVTREARVGLLGESSINVVKRGVFVESPPWLTLPNAATLVAYGPRHANANSISSTADAMPGCAARHLVDVNLF